MKKSPFPVMNAQLKSVRLGSESFSVTQVTAHAQSVVEGGAFVAIKGHSSDGHDLISLAVGQGARVIFGTLPFEKVEPSLGEASYIRVQDARSALADLAAEFYGHPSRALKVIGVTGTSGKTTSTYLIESVLGAAGEKVGVIGTIEVRSQGIKKEASQTTPGPVELQKILREMVDEGCTAVVMEVSSHALRQERVRCVAFDVVVFTNLSPEHLDYHPDLEDYYQAKKLLFTDVTTASNALGKRVAAVIHVGCNWGERLVKELGEQSQFSEIRPFLNGADSKASIKSTLEGMEWTYRGQPLRSKLVGSFNVENILAAYEVGMALKMSQRVIALGIERLVSVPGRLERVENKYGINVFVDYAHKPDALEKVLFVLKQTLKNGKLVCVFGCGGDRDRSKRPVMGKIASNLSDYVVITSDNPRTENPTDIIQAIEMGVELKPSEKHEQLMIESDRKRAIELGLQKALKLKNAHNANVAVLIAGKGHETYQIIGHQKIPFDDREIARSFFSSLDTKN